MTTVTEGQAQQGAGAERPPVVNDFAIVAATVNGSGSQRPLNN